MSSSSEADLDSFELGGDDGLFVEEYREDVDLDAKPAKTKKNQRRAKKGTGQKRRKPRRKRTVSDDDSAWEEEGSPPKKKKGSKPSKKATPKGERSTDDFHHTIDAALCDDRIDAKKAARLRDCLQSGDWSEVAYTLLCEQIPLKRRGKGCYNCQVCLVPKKGHNCPYCPVCSTPEDKVKKDEEHACFNCPYCFEDGKKRKKLVQIAREGHVCPHEAAGAQVPIAEV